MQLSGFDRSSRYILVPVNEPKLITRRRNPDGSYTENWAEPGELRFKFSTELTPVEDVLLDDILAMHNSAQRTQQQQREEQDETDLDLLEANYPNWDSFTPAQRNSFLKVLSRVAIRSARNSDF